MNMENYWVVRTEGKEREADSRTLRQWIEQGNISEETQIRKSDKDEWMKAGNSKEFSGLFKKSPDISVSEGFSIKNALGFGWNTTVKNLRFFIPLVLVMALFMLVDMFVIERIEQPLLGFATYLVYYAVYFLFQLGIIKVTLLFYDGEKPAFGMLFSQGNRLIKYVLTSILYFFIVLGGFILLIVPGIIWAIKFFFYDFLIVDRDAGIVESLKESSKITKGSRWELLGFGLVAVLINLLGIIPLGLGLFLTIPVTILATAYVYRRIELSSSSATEGEKEIEPAVTEA